MDANQRELKAISDQIDTYLELLAATTEPRRRGRRPDPERVQARIRAIDSQLGSRNLRPTKRLTLTAQRDQLADSIREPDDSVETMGQLARAEEAFVAGAAKWAKARGISRAAFRAMGVPKEVLDEAGL